MVLLIRWTAVELLVLEVLEAVVGVRITAADEEAEVVEFKVPLGLSALLGGGLGSLRRNQAWRRAALGFILAVGSHSKQRLIKSRNRGSSHPLRALWSSLDPGGPRCFPRLDRPPLRTVVPSDNVNTVQYLG